MPSEQEIRVTINGKWLWISKYQRGYGEDARNGEQHHRVK
jgi:hypothetical protein